MARHFVLWVVVISGIDFQGVAQATVPSCLMSTATWNIRFDNPSDGPHQWNFRKDALNDELLRLNPDILGLQEVLHHQFLDISSQLLTHESYGLGRDDGSTRGEFAPIFFRKDRFFLQDEGIFWLSPHPDHPATQGEFVWGSQVNRIATWVELYDEQTQRELLVINTHWDHQSALARQNSAELILDFLKKHPIKTVVLLGDLNALESEPSFTMLLSAQHEGSSLLQNARRRAWWMFETTAQTTLTRWKSLGSPGRHIDHIFVSPSVGVFTYLVVNQRFQYSDGMYYLSDHLPVIARLCIPPMDPHLAQSTH